MKKKFKIVCLMLVVVMMLSVMPYTALAVGDVVDDDVIVHVCEEEECAHYDKIVEWKHINLPATVDRCEGSYTEYYQRSCAACHQILETYGQSTYNASHSWVNPQWDPIKQQSFVTCLKCGITKYI